VTTALVEDGAAVDAVDTRTGFRKTEFRNGMI
jgi:beta-galactosidase